MSKCNGCKCQGVGCGTKHCDDLHKQNNEKIERAGKVIKDTEVCDLPKLISKGLENIWCVFKNIIRNICCLSNRMDCVEEKEYRIGRGIECIDPRITTLSLLVNYINSGRILSNKKLQELLDAWEKEVAEVKEHNAQEQNRYITEYNQYQQDLATLEAQTNTEGYPSKVFTQKLGLPQAGDIIEVLTPGIHEIPMNHESLVNDTTDLWERSGWSKDDVANVLGLRKGGYEDIGRCFIIPLNQTLTVKTKLPDNLAYYGNEHIKYLEISFTNKASAVVGGNTYISMYHGDALSFNYIAQKGSTHNYIAQKGSTHVGDHSDLEIKIKCINSHGNQIIIGNDAYMALNSLNSSGGSGSPSFEWALAPSYIYINGSTIHEQSDGRAYASVANDTIPDWDSTHNTTRRYIGAIIGNVSNQSDGCINVHFGCDNKKWAWFKVDTNIASLVVPRIPNPINRLPIPTKPSGEIQDLLDFSDDVVCLDKLDDPDSCINAHKERNPKHNL